jgi:hypothetical protein
VCAEIYYYVRVGDRLSLSTSYTHVDYNNAYIGKNPTFRRNISLPSSGLKRKPRRKPVEAGVNLSFAFLLIQLSLSWLNLRLWTSNSLQTTRSHKPEDRTLHCRRRDDLKSKKFVDVHGFQNSPCPWVFKFPATSNNIMGAVRMYGVAPTINIVA